MADVGAKAFVTLNDITSGNASLDTKYGGRVDIKREINDINFTLSVTDASIKDYEAAPWIKDAIITAEKKVNDNTTVGLGYDFGLKSSFASAVHETVLADKDVTAKATWFQNGNVLRAEGSVRLDSRSSISGAYNFSDPGNLSNATFINLKEREGFIIDPFRYPVSTAAAKYTLETSDGYIIEPAVDFKTQSPYLTVHKTFDGNKAVKAQYAFKEEVALVEVGWKPKDIEAPWVKAYAKAPLGTTKGVGPLSIGFIFDKSFNL
jgi:hypothetical protein